MVCGDGKLNKGFVVAAQTTRLPPSLLTLELGLWFCKGNHQNLAARGATAPAWGPHAAPTPTNQSAPSVHSQQPMGGASSNHLAGGPAGVGVCPPGPRAGLRAALATTAPLPSSLVGAEAAPELPSPTRLACCSPMLV